MVETKTISNPIDEELSIKFNGIVYTVEAKGILKLPLNAAMYWKNHIHTFLTFIDDVKEVEQEVEKVVKEVIEKKSETKSKKKV